MSSSSPPDSRPPTPTRAHLTRLMKLWRSAGWPSRDPIDVDLLAAGWVSLVGEHPAQECLKLTDAGLALLAQHRQGQRRAASTHDKLALRMADQLMESGRLVWHELSLRAQVACDVPAATDPSSSALGGSSSTPAQSFMATLPSLWGDDDAGTLPTPAKPATQWRLARPDLFSLRRTSNPAYLQPMVHEIKVSRADLFSDLRNKAKRASYQWLCSECYYVFPAGMAEPKELPEELGVWVMHSDADGSRLEMLRPARHAPCTLPFDVWMALAQATPLEAARVDIAQSELADVAAA